MQLYLCEPLCSQDQMNGLWSYKEHIYSTADSSTNERLQDSTQPVAHMTFVCGFRVNQIFPVNIFYVIIPGIFWLVGPIASSNWSEPELEQDANLSLLPTHALQKPCQHLKSTQAYFSQGG